jgi:hypothetical protein
MFEWVFWLVASDDEKLAENEEKKSPENLSCLTFFFLFGTFTSLQTFLSMSLSRHENKMSKGIRECARHVSRNIAFLLFMKKAEKLQPRQEKKSNTYIANR